MVLKPHPTENTEFSNLTTSMLSCHSPWVPLLPSAITFLSHPGSELLLLLCYLYLTCVYPHKCWCCCRSSQCPLLILLIPSSRVVSPVLMEDGCLSRNVKFNLHVSPQSNITSLASYQSCRFFFVLSTITFNKIVKIPFLLILAGFVWHHQCYMEKHFSMLEFTNLPGHSASSTFHWPSEDLGLLLSFCVLCFNSWTFLVSQTLFLVAFQETRVFYCKSSGRGRKLIYSEYLVLLSTVCLLLSAHYSPGIYLCHFTYIYVILFPRQCCRKGIGISVYKMRPRNLNNILILICTQMGAQTIFVYLQKMCFLLSPTHYKHIQTCSFCR